MKSFLTFISEGSRGYKRTLRRVNKAQAKYMANDSGNDWDDGARMRRAQNRMALTQKVRDPRIEARALKLASKKRATGGTAVDRLNDQSEKLSTASSIVHDFTNNFADEFEDNPMSELLTRLNLSSLKSSQRFPKKNRNRRIIDPTRLGVRRFTAKP